MIEIKKNDPPTWFERWKEDFAAGAGKRATYKNMLASCEGSVMETGEDHCGHQKNDWFSDKMVNPSTPEIKGMFRYGADGWVIQEGRMKRRQRRKR